MRIKMPPGPPPHRHHGSRYNCFDDTIDHGQNESSFIAARTPFIDRIDRLIDIDRVGPRTNAAQKKKNKMLIPIRCFTCGKVVGNKWEKYLELLQNDYSEGF